MIRRVTLARRAEPDQHRHRGPHSRHFRGPGGRLHARGGQRGPWWRGSPAGVPEL